MADQLDAQQIDTVLEAAERSNAVLDHQAAYDYAFPLVDGGHLSGAELGRGELAVGEACLGLGSYDAAMYYLELAAQHTTGDQLSRAQQLLADVRHLDSAQGVELDGVDGEQEAEAMLLAGEDAVRRNDWDTAWHYFSEAYNGLRLSKPQLSRAAVGMAECYVRSGDSDQAEGYLQIAEGQDPSGLEDRITAVRNAVRDIQGGAAALEGGLERTELDELNRAALAAAWNHDENTAYDLFMQLYESPLLPASDRGRIAVNLGVVCLFMHSYDAAHQFLTEGASIGRQEQADRANRLLQQLADRDRAAEVVAALDVRAEVVDAD